MELDGYHEMVRAYLILGLGRLWAGWQATGDWGLLGEIYHLQAKWQQRTGERIVYDEWVR